MSGTALRVEVAWGDAARQVVVAVELAPGATVADALRAAAGRHAGPLPASPGLAIHGQAARATTPLADGDRVELLGPLRADPKRRRRERAAARGS